MEIHGTTIVGKGAELEKDVKIGPFVLIEDRVEIGGGTEVLSHVVIKKGTKIGKNCRIYHGTVLGGEPQDVKFKGEESYLKIGDGTTIRECVTAHRADGEGESTEIGSGCYIMANCHVAHNCRIGEGVTMANLSTLGGFSQIGDRAFIGGLAAFHQYVRAGEYAMVGGGSILLEDVPPYMMVTGGHRPQVAGLNTVGLMRAGFSPETRRILKLAYRIMYRENRKMVDAAAELRKRFPESPEIARLAAFIDTTQRGISA